MAQDIDLDATVETLDALDRTPELLVHRFGRGDGWNGRVAVLPSAFNPPTAAHLFLLESARALAGIGDAAALLTTRNVSKGIYGAPLEHRIGMLMAAAGDGGDEPFSVLCSNAARIADQARTLRTAWPGIGFDVVTGYDTLIRLFDPRYYHGDLDATLGVFFEHHRLIAANRADAGIETVVAFLREPLVRPYASRIVPLEIDHRHAAMSSTNARAERLASDALTAEVAAYISQHNLYRDQEQVSDGDAG